MTIIIFSTSYLPFLGGAETAIKGITAHIPGLRFIILTSRFEKSLSRREKAGNLIIYRLGFGNRFDKFLLPFLAAFQFGAIRKYLQGPIMFWGMMVSYGSIGAWLLKFLYPKIPFLLTIQEGDSERHIRYGRFGLVGLFWRILARKADKIQVISNYLKELAISFGAKPEKIEVVPNGVELTKFENRNPKSENKKIIITISRLAYKNGVDILEKAFVIVKKKFPDAELRIISGAPHEEIPRHLWEADIFVRPSRSEGLGTAFLEAMAAGLPIIGTKVGGIPDFLKGGETGLFAKVDDPKDLAEKIELLFSDEALRQKLIQNGRRLVEEKYQWSQVANRMKKIFTELCAS